MPKDRLELTKQILLNEKRVAVSELSEKFQVTEETIRRDLDKLEAEGIANRTYGGAVLNPIEPINNVPFYKRAERNIEAKQKIAIKANGLLNHLNTLVADSSSTVMETLRLLKDCDDLTIVTNSTEAIKEFVLSEVTLLSTGGMLNKKSLSLQGDLAEKALEYYNIEVAVISAKGIDMNAGITDSNEEEAKIKRKMIDQAREVVLLIDTSKLGRKAFVKLIDFERIHTVVLEKQPDDEWMHFFEKNNVNVIY